MKSNAIHSLRQKTGRRQTGLRLWVTLESPSITEMAVALGLDWIVIDAEHGHLDWKEIVDHLRATVRSDTVALVRLAERNIGLVKASAGHRRRRRRHPVDRNGRAASRGGRVRALSAARRARHRRRARHGLGPVLRRARARSQRERAGRADDRIGARRREHPRDRCRRRRRAVLARAGRLFQLGRFRRASGKVRASPSNCSRSRTRSWPPESIAASSRRATRTSGAASAGLPHDRVGLGLRVLAARVCTPRWRRSDAIDRLIHS